MILLISARSVGQNSIKVQFTAGLADCYVSTTGNKSGFGSRLLPNMGIQTLIPIEGHFGIKTGILYQQKGWHAHNSYLDDSDEIRTEFSATITLHELTIPLQVSYTGRFGKSIGCFLAAGTSYDFAFSAGEDLVVDTYKREKYLQSTESSYHPYIGVIPDDSRLKNTVDGTMYAFFTPSIRLDAGFNWRKRYLFQAFWEHNINDIIATSDNTAALRLGYFGISAGIGL